MLTVGSIMTRDPITVSPESPMDRALVLMREHKLRHVPVLEHGRLVGMLSERDLMEKPRSVPRKGTPGIVERDVVVRDRMSVALETVTPDESAVQACRRLRDRHVGCLPVVRDGRLAGVLSESDLLQLYVRVCATIGRDPSIDPAVEACMSRNVLTIAPGARVSEAFELCRSKGVRHLPVLHEGWLVGIVSDRDVLPAMAEGELRRVETVMSKDFVAVTSGKTPLSEAAACMLRDDFHALPVLDNGALKGIVTSADVLLALGTIDEATLDSAWSSEEALSIEREEE